MSPLNSQTTYIYVPNSVSKFEGILFTPILLTAAACYTAGPLKFRLSCGSQNVPPPQTPIYNFKLWHPRCVLITVYKEWYQLVKHNYIY